MLKNPHNNNINKHNELHLFSNDIFCSESIVDLVPLHIKVVLVFWLVNSPSLAHLWITKFPFLTAGFSLRPEIWIQLLHIPEYSISFLLRKDSLLHRQIVSTRHVGGRTAFKGDWKEQVWLSMSVTSCTPTYCIMNDNGFLLIPPCILTLWQQKYQKCISMPLVHYSAHQK